MDELTNISIIIPSFNPSGELPRVVSGLMEAGFDDFIIVDDGSAPGHAATFGELGKLPGCTVLTHPGNEGKGAALKTAFGFFVRNRAGKPGFIMADGDGQHLAGDVLKCAQALARSDGAVVLGVRDFSRPGIPGRSLFGNRLTAFAFRALLGIDLRDTQTGLRGVPARYAPLLLEIQGSRFEYETNMLLELSRRGVPFHEIGIETVYGRGPGRGSHFRPLADSALIFARLLKYSLSGVLSFFADIGAFWLAMAFLGGLMGPWGILGCTAMARAVSSFFNFNLNRRLVFGRRGAYGRHLRRYYALASAQMLAAAGALWLLSALLGGGQPAWLLALLKVFVDAALFFLSFYVQSRWVFAAGA